MRAVAFPPEFRDAATLDLARQLFGPFAFQFELLSLVILTSIVAAVTLGMAKKAAR